MIILNLPYPISANRYWRPIHIAGRTMQAPSKEAKQYRLDVSRICAAAGITGPIAGRIALGVRLFPARPQDWARRARKLGAAWHDDVRCIDLDNANKVILDSLKGVAFDDDKWVHRLQCERMEPDEDGARVVVTIERLALPVVQASLIAETA
jgi:crossover junction endodeoxyribonuclease RusA